MSPCHSSIPSHLEHARRASAAGRWRPADVVALVVAGCHGAAALVLAWAMFLRLVR
jgi:hypothetical protein